ncbi:MAG: hypothetical protein KDD40_05510, partial [Bdellovibrionales bacterium]|nr:hypothetical protein [Bdellovibrionales bacterium]
KIESVNVLFIIQNLLLVAVIFMYFFIPMWPMTLNRINSLISPNLFNFNLKWYFILSVCIAILLIPVGLMGTNLPLLFSYLKQRNQYLAKTVGHLYSVNSLGGFLGAFLGGYYLLKWVSLAVAFKIYIILIAITLIFTALLYNKSHVRRRLTFAVVIFVTSLFFSLYSPPWSASDFTPGAFLSVAKGADASSYWQWYKQFRTKLLKNIDFIYSQSDPNTWTVVDKSKIDNAKTLYVNGKPDASTVKDAHVRAMNMLLPLSLAKNVDDVFIVGLGASLSTGIATKFSEVKSVDVAELSQGVIESMPIFNTESFNVLERQDKFNLFQTDAYRKLKSTDKMYNIIVSEPSNLWVTGVDLLFTLEFLQEAKNHLKPGGVYAQWFPLFDMDEDTFRMILANFNKVFPWVTVWATSHYTVNILAGNERLQPSVEQLKKRFLEQQDVYEKFQLNDYQTILGLQALPEGTTKGLTLDVKSYHSIEWPKLEFAANKALFLGQKVDLNIFLKSKIIKPLPVKQSTFRYLYEDLTESLSEKFYLQTLKRTGGPNNLEFINKRMVYFYNNAYKNPKVKINNLIKSALDYFIAGQKPIDLNIEQLDKSLKIIDLFKLAMTMHLPVNIKNLHVLLPENCGQQKNCYLLKRYITAHIFASEVSFDKNLSEHDKLQIEEKFKYLMPN